MENKYQGYKNPLTGKRFRVVGAPIVKKDARALVTGKPVYTDDLAPKDCLVVKVLRSPHAHALVEEIDCGVAAKIPGIECILTWKDVPQKRFTMAGQTFPEPSPYDRLILDRRLRFVGDAVAIVAGSSVAAVDHAAASLPRLNGAPAAVINLYKGTSASPSLRGIPICLTIS